MKIYHLLGLVSLLAVHVVASAQSTPTTPTALANPPATDPLQNELSLVARAHAAVRADNDTSADAQLLAATTLPEAITPSVLLARRACLLCGWLQNENDYARAEKVAQRMVARLASLTETTDTDHEERLYWEACLEARFLDHKVRAIALLRAAEQLNPKDARVTDLELPLVAAVNSFGR